jgi:hypothetical protein
LDIVCHVGSARGARVLMALCADRTSLNSGTLTLVRAAAIRSRDYQEVLDVLESY